MDFSQTGFSFDIFPSQGEVYGYSLAELQYFCGMIISAITSSGIAAGIKLADLGVSGPVNVSLGLGDDELVVGINTTKASLNSKALLTLKEDVERGRSTSEIQDDIKSTGLYTLGSSDFNFFVFPRKSFELLHPKIKEIVQQNLRYKMTISPITQWATQGTRKEMTERAVVVKNIFFSAEKYVKNIQKGLSIMQIEPNFQARGIVVKPNQGFYVLPFTHFPLQAFQAIQKGILKNKIDCQIIKSEDRFDPNRGNNIVENIWQDICESRFVIADLSERNPNVFYELGICDTIGKIVIPICSNRSRKQDYPKGLPFDVAREYTVFYDEDFDGYTDLQVEVVKRIRAIIENGRNVLN